MRLQRHVLRGVLKTAGNPKQDSVINSVKGIYVVDAGAGTGKTYSITRRYLEILKQPGIKPKDILLLTFTDNAAVNMKEKIMNKLLETDPEINFLDAKISTFHSFCRQILIQDCRTTPRHLGIDHQLSENYQISENQILENLFFKRIYNSFKKENPQYDDEFRIIGDRHFEILSLIGKLLSKGIFPKKQGWFLNGEKILRGNKEEFIKKAKDSEEELPSALKKFKSKKTKMFYDLPEDLELNNEINPETLIQSLDENRDRLINFVHDIYFSYIETSVKENRLTFDFLIMFAFLELYYNKPARENNSFEYLMIDEFQDTNEMQFMLSLLLMKTNNLCVVGDWKQGIYGFRNATIDNITEFKDKIKNYKEELNRGETRINFDVQSEAKEFDINFRSSQKILDFSKNALIVKGSQKEWIDNSKTPKIVDLKANFDLNQHSEIEFYKAKNRKEEIKFILKKIQDIIKNKTIIKEYGADDSFKERTAEFKDIAVLSRTRSFGLELQEEGLKNKIPINYEGGIELFKTKESVLLLAVLRILVNRNDRKGWASILDHCNYSLGDKEEIIETEQYPPELKEIRTSLFKHKKNIVFLTSKIFEEFKIKNAYSNAIIKNIASIFETNLTSVESLVYFIEQNISNEGLYEIDFNTSENEAKIKTIHGSKGLEFPIVFVANCNEMQFPSRKPETDIISLNKNAGLRCSKQISTKNSYTAVFDNWKTDLIKSFSKTDYDEERRLLFVAATRAKQHLFFTASKPSTFYKDLSESLKKEPSEIEKTKLEKTGYEQKLQKKEIKIGEYNPRGSVLSAHDLMEYQQDKEGRGIEFGQEIHNYAERLAIGLEVTDTSQETLRIKKFLDQIKCKKLLPETEISIYIGKNLIRGIIDLLIVYEDKIEIIDYKTDTSMLNHEEYRKQLSVYYHAVKEFYSKPTAAKIFYVSQNKTETIEPMTKKELENLSDKIF